LCFNDNTCVTAEKEAGTEGKLLVVGCETGALQGYGLNTKHKVGETGALQGYGLNTKHKVAHCVH